MAGPFQTGGADHVNADRVFCDLDTAHATQGLADQIIAQNKRFQAEA